MHFDRREPASSLKTIILEYWIFENLDPEVSVQKIIPDGFSEIIIHYGDPYEINFSGTWERQERLLYSNQISKHFFLKNTGISGVFGIKLHPTGFYQLFGNAQAEFTDQVVPLSQIMDIPINIQSLTNPDFSTFERINEIENWLLTAIRSIEISVITKACQLVLEKKGLISVDELADNFSISVRHLEREFKKVVGITPKLYIRIIKFGHIFKVMQEDKPWVQVALQSGYFDQSHFIKNFKSFTGEEPSKYGFNEETLANFFLKK